MSRPRRFQTALAVAFTLAGLAPLVGQTLKPSAMPIDLAVDRATALPGTSIRMSGTAGHDGQRRAVAILVTTPTGRVATLTAMADPAGSFAVAFDDDQTPGTYHVRATSTDGNRVADAAFTIVTPAGIVDTDIRTIVSIAADLTVAASSIAQSVASMPASRSQRALEDRLASLQTRLATAPQQADALSQAWPPLQQVISEYPGLSLAFQPAIEQLLRWNGRAKTEMARVRPLLQAGARRGVTCDTIDSVTQALDWMAAALDFAGDPIEILKVAVTGEGLDERVAPYLALLPSARREDARGMLTQAIARAAGAVGGPDVWVTSLVGFEAATADAARKQVFDPLCGQFEGPFSVSLHVDFFDQGQTSWSYDLDLSGDLQLRYARRPPGGPAIPFTGQFEGHVTRVTLRDNFPAIYPKMASDVLWHADRTPAIPSTCALDDWGGRPRRAFDGGATSFTIPVTGERVGNRLTVQLRPAAGRDINLRGSIIYIFVATGTFFAQTAMADAPYQHAYWILSRGIGVQSDFTVTADSTRRVSRIARSFARTTRADDGSFAATIKAQVYACNPACP